MPATLLVMIGGAIGALCRYWLGKFSFLLFGMSWPWGTLAANLIGGLAMGLLAGILGRLAMGGEVWRLFVGVGILGGFTTFSSFSLETAMMIERGALLSAGAYVGASVVGAIGALFVGLMIARVVA
ncbi:MAG: fluoride efflux transporter CrcB [Sphingomonas sanxanigenens]|uniref:Fluoride-specific ion channel FluC n=1 Tax=Sphingomonas sanxanigenens TaxID=397260 RepID=A0A2W5AAH1_9SPHN|nr:MAG: fluoride efflux transporter CrcB [Sphingomonas sanxanigenens]